MSDDSSGIDDLEALRAELDLLRDELGEGYVEYEGGGDGSDVEDGGVGGTSAALPGAALAALTATTGDSDSEEYEYSQASEEEGEYDEEEEEEQQQQQQQQEEQPSPKQRQARMPASKGRPARQQAPNKRPARKPAPKERPAQQLTPRERRPRKRKAEAQAQAREELDEGAEAAATIGYALVASAQQAPRSAMLRSQQLPPSKAADAASTAKQAAQPKGRRAVAFSAPPPPPRHVPVSKVQAVQEALEANRELQSRLRRLLASTSRAIDCNANVLHRVRALKAKKNAPPAVGTVPVTTAEPGAQLQAPIGSSWFWGGAAGGGTAAGAASRVPPNPDAEALKPLYQHLPFRRVFRSSRWSEDEQARLRAGVLQAVQEVQVREVMEEMQQRLESGGSVSRREYEANKSRIAGLTLQSPGVDQLAAGFREEDWALLVQRQRLQRTTTECRLQWSNSLAPGLSQEEWGQKEDELLMGLAEKHGQRQWDTVSRELVAAVSAAAGSSASGSAGSGGITRPPLACLQRYQLLVAAAAKEARSFGTEEGIARLAELVAKHSSAWKRIAEEFGGGWDPDQLMHIWRRHAQRGPQARKGRWSQEEDDLLLQAMALHGRKWSLVAKMVPGRTDVQCRERYMSSLNPDVHNYKAWEAAEEAELLARAKEYTRPNGRIKWAAVATHLPGRTDRQCTDRWKFLTSAESKSPRAGKVQPKKKARGAKRKKPPAAAAGSAEAELAAEGELAEGAETAAEQEQRPEQGEDAEGQEAAVGEQLEQAAAAQPEEAAQQQKQQAAPKQSRSARRQPKRARSEEAEEDQAPPPVLPAAPEPTAAAMPCSRADAVGQRIRVWWIIDEASGSGSMYPGMVTAWSRRSGEHSVRYQGESRATKCRLQEEVVEWVEEEGAPITGPGAPWPDEAAAAAAEEDGAHQEQQEQQQEQQQGAEPGGSADASEQLEAAAGRRPARQRRKSAKAAAMDEG